MRWTAAIITALISLGLIVFLNRSWGTLPAFGKLLSPTEGFWQNAEPVDKDFSGELRLPALRQPVKIWLDERLVPHIFASNEHDLYFAQGYITARFRLWQMETQTRAAAGRLSEVMGMRTLAFDRRQRRQGMVSAAESSLKYMEQDSATRNMLETYTNGINAYINSLNNRTIPLEYKLLGYTPEPWTPLKCALLMKYMSDNLTGASDDLEYTNALHSFSLEDFNKMFPEWPDSLDPIIPTGTVYSKKSMPVPVIPQDSQWLSSIKTTAASFQKPDRDNGSNNWAVSGTKTKSGVPVLCNDPHLGLNLPSLWYEIQLHTPQMNVYGVSLPGAPAVVIGFNDSIAWGLTNASRDVKDFYSLRFKDNSMQEYWFNGAWKEASLRIETLKIKGGESLKDTIAYTVFGPVMFDPHYPDTMSGHQYLAMHWQAAEPSNELKTLYLLNHARNYPDYENALQYFQCPGQNFAFASHSGDIAIWQQGKFPVKWKNQGRFIMPGEDSTFLWQGYIPFIENPHILNPERGFVSSANQHPADSLYPYYYTGDFEPYRGHRINTVLRSENNITIQDMMKLQNDTYNTLAGIALPLMFHFLDSSAAATKDISYLHLLKQWDCYNRPEDVQPAIFKTWWDNLYDNIWEDDLRNPQGLPMPRPENNTTIEALLSDSAFKFIDNKNTNPVETLRMQVTNAFYKAMKTIASVDSAEKLPWGKYKGTNIMHLARLPAFSRMHLNTGGGASIVNANKIDHGPSWRMVVQLSNPIEAYGVYPGGQSGNPGSRYYDNFIDDWTLGKYYPLHFLSEKDSASRYVHFRITLTN